MNKAAGMIFGLGMVAGAGMLAAPPMVPALAQAGLAKPVFVADDAARAAATRLLAASRFRERQEILLPDSMRAAQAELSADCIDRATAGQGVGDCGATHPDPAMRTRLAASQSDMLDEIIAASQGVYARRFSATEMDEITRFFRTPVGRKYGAQYPAILSEVQARKRSIIRRYLIAAGDTTAKRPIGIARP